MEQVQILSGDVQIAGRPDLKKGDLVPVALIGEATAKELIDAGLAKAVDRKAKGE